ncbi:hypothetical protein TWF730_004772 [Orbilia blumenaviensis]|uniref:Uncharacterized protein n=1 Tax=Orbilia blumenaviensis TaxID=1796055 RepID=A0AAV9TWZ6_9PEZI
MKPDGRYTVISSLGALVLVVCHVQAAVPILSFDLEGRSTGQSLNPRAKASSKIIPPKYYNYDSINTDSTVSELRWSPEYLWSGALEFSKLKGVGLDTGKKSKNILSSSTKELRCLGARTRKDEDEGLPNEVEIDHCTCSTGSCEKDNNINSPSPRFQWNFRGRILHPAIYKNWFVNIAPDVQIVGTRGEKQMPLWYGYIESAYNDKCLTFRRPVKTPPPFLEGSQYGKIGDVVLEKCVDDQNFGEFDDPQLWVLWVFRKDAETRLLPRATHLWQTCVAKGKRANERHYRGLVWNTDPTSGRTAYFGCHDSDHTAISPHPWFFRAATVKTLDITGKQLDAFANKYLIDFA